MAIRSANTYVNNVNAWVKYCTIIVNDLIAKTPSELVSFV